jgi:phosphatidylglycerol:prolipoprotein diacylglycerol transferase
LHPILFSAGSFRLPTYGVLMVVALVAGLYTAFRVGKREGLDSTRLFDFSTWLIVVSLVGAKVLLILTHWEYYWDNPGEILSWSTFQAGGVFYGGFIAAVLFALWYVRVHRLPMWKVFDAYVPAVALGLGIGRVGCFAAGCDYGKPTTSFLGVVFTNSWSHDITGVPLGVTLHPTQLYESATSLVIFGILLWWFRRKSYDGQVFVMYLVLYAVARFFLEFLRGDADRGFLFDHLFSTSQFIALLALATAAGLTVYFHRRRGEMELSPRDLPAAKHARD